MKNNSMSEFDFMPFLFVPARVLLQQQLAQKGLILGLSVNGSRTFVCMPKVVHIYPLIKIKGGDQINT